MERFWKVTFNKKSVWCESLTLAQQVGASIKPEIEVHVFEVSVPTERSELIDFLNCNERGTLYNSGFVERIY